MKNLIYEMINFMLKYTNEAKDPMVLYFGDVWGSFTYTYSDLLPPGDELETLVEVVENNGKPKKLSISTKKFLIPGRNYTNVSVHVAYLTLKFKRTPIVELTVSVLDDKVSEFLEQLNYYINKIFLKEDNNVSRNNQS